MIFDNPFFTEMLLPFLLVFVIIFAILQKSKILGEGKAQIDAIVALVIGLLLIGVPGPRDIVVGLMPWMAVGIAVILVFLILYGFVAGDLSTAPTWMKITFGILAGLFTIGIVVYVSGTSSLIKETFTWLNSTVVMNIVMIILVVGAVIVAVTSSKKTNKSKSSED